MTFSKEELIWWFSKSLSRNEILEQLFPGQTDWRRIGQNLKNFCRKEGLNVEYDEAVTRDFQKRGHRIPNDQLFIREGNYPALIRSRLIKDKLIPYECANLDCPTHILNNVWRGQPLSLDMDHIDGNNRNHELNNLRFLCKNCHGQTDTFAAKNTAKAKKGRRSHICPICKGLKSSKVARTCMKCKNVKEARDEK